MKETLRQWKRRFGEALVRWGTSLEPPSSASSPAQPGSAGRPAQTSRSPRPRKPVPPRRPGGSLAAASKAPVLAVPPVPPVRVKPMAVSPAEAKCPGLREPLSVESAVLSRDLSVLKREAADALAALGAAHALVTSARLAQVQEVRNRFDKGEVADDVVVALAGDYQGWQNDQVRLFDALALVLRMRVPQGNVLDQVDPGLHKQALSHLESLSLEYQRRLLMEQFPGR
jgi:hypothetical protein